MSKQQYLETFHKFKLLGEFYFLLLIQIAQLLCFYYWTRDIIYFDVTLSIFSAQYISILSEFEFVGNFRIDVFRGNYFKYKKSRNSLTSGELISNGLIINKLSML